jgi:hypothetical protein
MTAVKLQQLQRGTHSSAGQHITRTHLSNQQQQQQQQHIFKHHGAAVAVS